MAEKKTIERLLLAMEKLNSKGELVSDRFCKESGISSRTFARLIQDLRNMLNIPLIYDIRKNVYMIDRSAVISKKDEDILDTFSQLNSNNEMLFFYSFVKNIVESEYFFPPLNPKEKGKKITDYSQILRVLEKFVPIQDRTISEYIEYYISDHYKLNMKLKFKNMMETILKGFKTKKLLSFTYNDAKLIVEPLKLVFYNGKWYLIGYFTKSTRTSECNKVRTYNLSHIVNIRNTNENFPKHEQPDIDFKTTFGFFMDEEELTAVIRFYGKVVIRDVKETVWFEGQKTSSGIDTDRGEYFQYEISYPKSGNVELIARILKFGRNAEIMSPPKLRERWIEEIIAMNEMISKFK